MERRVSWNYTGVSYLGLASWAAMREEVPALKAVAPILAATDTHFTMFGRHSGAAHVELFIVSMVLFSDPFNNGQTVRGA